MQKIIKTSGLHISKDYIFIEKIKSDLTVKIQNYMTDEIELKYYYEDYIDHILIPRNYPLPPDCEIIDNTPDGEKISFVTDIIPRNQTQIDGINLLSNDNNKILKLSAGFGKTIMAIQSICNRGLKTIIIIPKKKLMQQWKNEIIKNTSLQETDISILSTIKYKEKLNSSIILSTPQVISLAVLKQKTEFLKDLQNCGVSYLIIDEIHSILGGEHFSKSSLNLNVKYVMGLSATPLLNNEDLNRILKYHVGQVVEIIPKKEELMIPNVVSIHKNFNINKKNHKYINFGGKFNMLNYSRMSVKSEEYTSTVLKYINKCYHADRTILILGNYIKELLYFADKCDAPKNDIGMFVPTCDKKLILKVSDTTDLDEAWNNRKIVYGTYKGARDGNNRESLDTLIMLGACSNILQAVGRINRKIDNKKNPLVVEFVDIDTTIRKIWNLDKTEKIQKFLKNFEDRKVIYDKYGWPVKIYKN